MTQPARTALYDIHAGLGARLTNFAGWSMPLHYGSQLAEHHAVRQSAGVFDVSHMTITDIHGPQAGDLLGRVVAADPARAAPGRAVYGVLLNESGGVIDDHIVYGRGDSRYRLVTNAATRQRVLPWLLQHAAGRDVTVEERADLAMLAVQGPDALEIYATASDTDVRALDSLPAFSMREQGDCMLARTGYTGEEGVEAMLPGADAVALWQRLTEAGARPIGLAARDTLRLEAGLNLYGQDMDETTTPRESNLGWTVALDGAPRAFIGREALQRERAGGRPSQRLRGIVMEARGVLRHGQRVSTTAGEGTVTSGTFSPTLGYSIALARLPSGAAGECSITIRDKPLPGRIVSPPFVRHGTKVHK